MPDKPPRKNNLGMPLKGVLAIVVLLGLGSLIVAVSSWLFFHTTPENTALDNSVTNSIGMKLAPIPPGTFTMGSPPDEEDRAFKQGWLGEGPQHEVWITRPFYLGVYEVTQAEYERVMGTNPSYHARTGSGKGSVANQDTSRFPVEQVSHNDATEFCRKLSELPAEKNAGRLYRLPTEAEWEYACRGGASFSTPFHYGRTLSTTQANFSDVKRMWWGISAKGIIPARTCQVGSYQPNAFGLYDMHGNVSEWCADWYDRSYYSNSPKEDPQGPASIRPENGRVVRGGSQGQPSDFCRTAFRGYLGPGVRYGNVGFRVVLVFVVRTQ